MKLAEPLQQRGRLRPGVVRGVEELQRRREGDGEGLLADRLDGREAVIACPRQPGMRGDGGVVGRDPVGDARDVGGDLQGRLLRVGRRPEGRAAGRVGHRQREREPAVGQRHRVEPLAQLERPRGCGGRDVLEHLERVQRPGGLALGGSQVGLQAPAVAAVGVAVGLHGGQGRARSASSTSSSKRRRSSRRAWLAMNPAAAGRSKVTASIPPAPRSAGGAGAAAPAPTSSGRPAAASATARAAPARSSRR